jgi:hypothetical protein
MMEDKDEEINRTRHDYFYMQLVAHNYILFRKVLKKFEDPSIYGQMLELKSLMDEKGESLSMEDIDKPEYEKMLKDLALILFNLKAASHSITVFTALCLESLINDYCALKKSSNFLKTHVDKLDTPSKWIIIPKLVTNKEISTDSQAYELLKELFSLRNEMVHPKSKEYTKTIIAKELAKLYYKQTDRSFLTMKEATHELYKIDPSFHYLEDYKWLWDSNEKLKDISDLETLFYTFMGKQKNNGG